MLKLYYYYFFFIDKKKCKGLRGFYVRTTQIENSVPADTWWNTWHILVINTNKVLCLCDVHVPLSLEKSMYGSMHHDDAPQIAIIEVLKRGTIWEDQNCHHFNQRSAILWNLDYAVVVLACTRIDRRSTFLRHWAQKKTIKFGLNLVFFRFWNRDWVGWVLWAFDNWAFFIFKLPIVRQEFGLYMV